MQEYLPDFKITNAALHFDEASRYMRVIFKQEVKKKGKNYDLTVVEYKVTKEEKIENSNIFLKAIEKIKQFMQAYRSFAPLIEE